MVPVRPPMRSRARSALAAVAGLAVVVAGRRAASPAVAADPRPLPSASIPSVPGLGAVDTPDATTTPQPLPKRTGTVAVQSGQHVVTSRSRTAAATGFTTLAIATDQVAVRALVVAVDAADFGVATWGSHWTGWAPPTTSSTPRPPR